MRNAHGSERRIRATHVFGLTAIMVLLLACVARVEAAVDLLYFRATGFENYVLVEWATAQELDNVGFNLYRTEAPNFNDPNKVDLGFIPAQHPGKIWGADYSYTDSDIQTGTTYYYWLEDVDFHGVSTRHGPESATPGPSATATPTSTPTETATSTPTATPTSTPTNLLTATPASTPTAVPSATPTSTPTSLPSGTPASTLATPPTATPASVATLTPSPALTTIATSETPSASAPAAAEITPSDTATTHAVAATTEPGATPSGSARTRWPAIPIPSILIFVAVTSFLGVLLLSIVLVVVRKFGL